MSKEFGEYVRTLREQRTFTDSSRRTRQWTRAKLAQESNGLLTEVVIRNIEQGKVANLKNHLKSLALALNLTENAKEELYARAGYVYTKNGTKWDESFIKALFEQLHHAASIRTPLWDFVAFNSYHAELWGHTPQTINALNTERIGPNLLRVMFDPLFQHKSKVFGNEIQIREDLLRGLYAFRVSSMPYVTTHRYKTIIEGMQRYPEFQYYWAASEGLTDIPNSLRPLSKIQHATLGIIEFMSLRIPEKYLGNSMEVSVYVPMASSESAYQQIRDKMKLNHVYFFRREDVK
jgi:hypothetical protein